uniref:THAP-type domain-containing protein n=2 Tax=Acrobeloides nanus TaxID=290746 RepID=A0A914DW58_9BILA
MEVTCLCCKKVLKDKAYPVKIPDNNYIRQHWLAVMKMDVKKNINKIDKQNYLCSTHFDEEDILGKTLNETILHYEALPKPLKFKAKKFINEEKVNRIKEQQVKESLLGEEMLPKNGWRQLPSEIKFIILSFLCKNDLEKYQLVSSEWNKIILGSSNTFPLRQVETLYRQGDYCFLTLPGFSKCFKQFKYISTPSSGNII